MINHSLRNSEINSVDTRVKSFLALTNANVYAYNNLREQILIETLRYPGSGYGYG